MTNEERLVREKATIQRVQPIAKGDRKSIVFCGLGGENDLRYFQRVKIHGSNSDDTREL